MTLIMYAIGMRLQARPDSQRPAVAMNSSPVDLPLIGIGRKSINSFLAKRTTRPITRSDIFWIPRPTAQVSLGVNFRRQEIQM